jgi:hypothetical protein
MLDQGRILDMSMLKIKYDNRKKYMAKQTAVSWPAIQPSWLHGNERPM